MKTKVTILTALSITLCGVESATISVNFGTNARNGTTQTVGGGTAGVVAVGNWNELTGSAGGPSALVNDSGAGTTAMGSWGTGGTWGGTAPDGSLSGDRGLMGAWLDGNSASVTGIPYAMYDVIIYGSSDVGNGGRALGWTVNGSAVKSGGTFSDPLSADGNYFFGTHVDGSTATNNPSYIRVNGLSGNLTIGDHPDPTTSTRSPIAGFQIIEVVPEPSSSMLFGLGGLLLILQRRK